MFNSFFVKQGVSADWWNYRHFIHHAKPNAIHKDHDMRFYPLAVVGKVMPREVIKSTLIII